MSTSREACPQNVGVRVFSAMMAFPGKGQGRPHRLHALPGPLRRHHLLLPLHALLGHRRRPAALGAGAGDPQSRTLHLETSALQSQRPLLSAFVHWTAWSGYVHGTSGSLSHESCASLSSSSTAFVQ